MIVFMGEFTGIYKLMAIMVNGDVGVALIFT